MSSLRKFGWFAALASGMAIASATNANAFDVINIDENGNGGLHSVSGAIALGYDGAFADPTVGGHPTLSYRLDDLSTTVVQGDVVLIEPQGGPGGGTNSDLVRFVTTSIGGRAATRIYFYSDTSDSESQSDLADTGTPSSGIGQWPGAGIEQQIPEIGTEGNNGVYSYMPTKDTMPGFLADSLGGPVNYIFNSDGVIVSNEIPEPATLALLGVGLVGLGLARRHRAA
jgi:hypothetical protein